MNDLEDYEIHRELRFLKQGHLDDLDYAIKVIALDLESKGRKEGARRIKLNQEFLMSMMAVSLASKDPKIQRVIFNNLCTMVRGWFRMIYKPTSLMVIFWSVRIIMASIALFKVAESVDLPDDHPAMIKVMELYKQYSKGRKDKHETNN